LPLTQFAGVFLILVIGALIALALKAVTSARGAVLTKLLAATAAEAGQRLQPRRERSGASSQRGGERRRPRIVASLSASELAAAPMSFKTRPQRLAEEQEAAWAPPPAQEGSGCLPSATWWAPAAAAPPQADDELPGRAAAEATRSGNTVRVSDSLVYLHSIYPACTRLAAREPQRQRQLGDVRCRTKS
jgi:hypothetical protein